jgi:hypothetical protein
MLSVLGLLAGLAGSVSAASGVLSGPGEPIQGPLPSSGSTPSATVAPLAITPKAGASADSEESALLGWDAAFGRRDRRTDLLQDDAWLLEPRPEPASVRTQPVRRAKARQGASTDLIELTFPRWQAPVDEDQDTQRNRTRVVHPVMPVQPDFRRKASQKTVDPRKARRGQGKARPAQRIRPKSWNLLLPRAEPPAPLPADEGPTANRLPGGQSRMEMHFGENLSEGMLTTFVGGSQEEEAASATAFGRGIGAEAGLQYSQSAAWAYRVRVGRKFVNDLDEPSQSAKLSFQVNVRF